MKRIHEVGLVYAAVLLAALAAVQLVGRDWTLTVAVAVLGLLVASVGLGFRRHRAVLGALEAQNRRLGATNHRLRRLESASRSSAKAKNLQMVARNGRQQYRELRKQVVTLRKEANRERNAQAEKHAQIVASLHDLKKHVLAVEAATQPPVRPSVGDRPFLVGQEMFADLVLDGREPSVVLAFDSFTPSQLFAGVRTALLTAVEVARQTGRPLRLVVMRQPETTHEETVATLFDWVAHEAKAPELAAELRVSFPDAPHRWGHHTDDIWVATYWSTAYCINTLVDAGVVRPERVVYVVQDWEPGFFPWGTEYALARATYSYGFRLIVNSTSLAAFLQDNTEAEIAPGHVFAPQVDQPRLHQAAALWEPSADGRPRLLFYARPAKPRNLFTLGLESVRRWVQDLPEGTRPVITLAGGDCGEVSVGPGADVVVQGKLDLDGYYELLTRTDLALALMHSPHPSHLPLELPMAGIPTVTNSMGRYRREWLAQLHVCSPTPEAVARGLDKALADATAAVTHTPQVMPGDLGLPLEQVVSTVARELSAPL